MSAEPLHLTAEGRKTACGRDLRGLRSTKQRSLVTCKHCYSAVILELVERRTGRRPEIGGFVGVPPSRFAAK